jgi:hypothetical protein
VCDFSLSPSLSRAHVGRARGLSAAALSVVAARAGVAGAARVGAGDGAAADLCAVVGVAAHVNAVCAVVAIERARRARRRRRAPRRVGHL